MSEVTFEYALEVVRALSLEDQDRLRQWLAERESQHTSAYENNKVPSRDWYVHEMRWLREHHAAYAGQWVALAGDRLFSHHADARQVYAEAHAAGITVPFVAYIETPDESQWDGWAMR